METSALMKGGAEEEGAARTVANLHYKVRGDVKTACEYYRKTLSADRWKEQPDSYITDQSASGVFARNKFLVSVTVYPDAKPGLVSVMLHHHGNVNLSKLPRPADTKPVYEGPITAMYVTAASVADTVENCKKLLLAAGWEPHGSAGDSSYFKQNAVRITLSISSASAQDGKTSISYLSELLSADLPAPPDAIDLRYVDSQRKLTFDTTAEKEAVAEYYKGALAKTGFKPNKEELISVDDKFTTMAEMDEAGKRFKEKFARDKEMQKAEEEKAKANRPRVSVSLPDDATGVEVNKSSIKFIMGNGKAKAWAEAWKKPLLADGWKEGAASLDSMAGMISLSKDGQSMNLSYTDTGFTPAEIKTTAIGVDLDKANAK